MEAWLGVSLLQLALIQSVVLAAAFVRGLTGFGLAIILVPPITLIIPPERTVLLAILIAGLGGGIGYRAAWASVDRRVVAKVIAGAALTVPLGTMALSMTPPDVARLLIAGIAVGAFFVIARKRAPLPPPGDLPLYATGAAMGFLGAFAAMPGPPVVNHFVRDGIPAAASRDMMIVLFFWAPLLMAGIAVAAGRIDLKLALLAVVSLPTVMLGSRLGERYFGRILETQWRWLVLGLIGTSACGSLLHLVF